MDTYKICSWDVGIKNLAYCLMEHNFKTNTMEILEWDIINLIEGENTYKCNCINIKDKKSCNKKATYKLELGDQIKYFCNIHYKNYDINENKPLLNIINETEKNKCQHLIKNKDEEKLCNKNTKTYVEYGDTKKYLCSAHLKSFEKNYKSYYTPIKIKTVKASEYGKSLLSSKIANKLDSNEKLYNVNCVLIENQPTLKNPLMKTISCFLYHHYNVRCNIDKKNSNISINFISPSNKLKIADEQTNSILLGGSGKASNVYKLTKNLSEEYSSVIIKNTKWEDYIKKYKKKDDLCDALLQGYHYLYFRNNKDFKLDNLKDHNKEIIKLIEIFNTKQNKKNLKVTENKNKKGEKIMKLSYDENND